MPAPATDLRVDLHRAGYYPELVGDVLDVALADEDVVAHLVHPETTFDAAEVRRHVTVLVLTPTRLVVAHVDDHPADSEHPSASASATTEAVPLAELKSVALTHVVGQPDKHKAGTGASELTLVIGWGAVSRVDLEPATCGDPNCDADHGLTGHARAGRRRRPGERARGGRRVRPRRDGVRPSALGGQRPRTMTDLEGLESVGRPRRWTPSPRSRPPTSWRRTRRTRAWAGSCRPWGVRSASTCPGPRSRSCSSGCPRRRACASCSSTGSATPTCRSARGTPPSCAASWVARRRSRARSRRRRPRRWARSGSASRPAARGCSATRCATRRPVCSATSSAGPACRRRASGSARRPCSSA